MKGFGLSMPSLVMNGCGCMCGHTVNDWIGVAKLWPQVQWVDGWVGGFCGGVVTL